MPKGKATPSVLLDGKTYRLVQGTWVGEDHLSVPKVFALRLQELHIQSLRVNGQDLISSGDSASGTRTEMDQPVPFVGNYIRHVTYGLGVVVVVLGDRFRVAFRDYKVGELVCISASRKHWMPVANGSDPRLDKLVASFSSDSRGLEGDARGGSRPRLIPHGNGLRISAKELIRRAIEARELEGGG